MYAALEQVRQRHEQGADEGGFTLIELLIIIVILGILSAIIIFAVQTLTGSAVTSSCSSDLKTVENAVEAYKAQMGGYPNGTAAANGAITDADVAGTNAVGAPGRTTGTGTNSELLTGSATTATSGTDTRGNVTQNYVSPSGQAVGPWIKDVPVNPRHYTIIVANDGTGAIQVKNVAGTLGADCSAVGP
jgi:general secretion pathway protein G